MFPEIGNFFNLKKLFIFNLKKLKIIECNNMSSERVLEVKGTKRWTLIIAGSAIFGALSLVFSFIVQFLPRVPGWGLAFFDPVSIIWILAFFVFGYEAGAITCAIGMLLLMPFDSFAPVGPLMKFVATFIMVFIPWIINKFKKVSYTSQDVIFNKRLIINGCFAWILRVVTMVFLNCLVISLMLPFFPSVFDMSYLGLPSITGWTAIILTVILINSLQSVWDYLVPFGIVKILKKYSKLGW